MFGSNCSSNYRHWLLCESRSKKFRASTASSRVCACVRGGRALYDYSPLLCRSLWMFRSEYVWRYERDNRKVRRSLPLHVVTFCVFACIHQKYKHCETYTLLQHTRTYVMSWSVHFQQNSPKLSHEVDGFTVAKSCLFAATCMAVSKSEMSSDFCDLLEKHSNIHVHVVYMVTK